MPDQQKKVISFLLVYFIKWSGLYIVPNYLHEHNVLTAAHGWVKMARQL